MTILKNGSTLLVESLTPNGEAVVLAITPGGAFATWRKDDEGNTFSGDYYPPTVEGLKGAIDSLEARARFLNL